MKKSLPIIIVITLAFAAAGGAWLYSSNNTATTQTNTTNTSSDLAAESSTGTTPATNSSAISQTISPTELAKNNGKNGAKCWVAVNGTVYDVTNADQWRNGQHIPSDGEASCGADMSNVIGKSPHGNKVLAELPIIGALK